MIGDEDSRAHRDFPMHLERGKNPILVVRIGRDAMPLTQEPRQMREGVDLLSPDTGEILCELTTTVSSAGGVALVDVTDDRIYVLTGDGSVHALRHSDEAS
jgi:hypothetical protein